MRKLPTGTVTFLFTDIEGSTLLLQKLGDRYADVQDAHAAILRKAIAGGGGTEIRTEGDSFFAVFPTAAGAVRAAVEAQRGLASEAWPHGRPVRVRMGLHTGEGRLGGDDYLGIDVNRAARIAAAGHGGQVLLSRATYALVEHDLPEGVSLRDLGEHRLKDLGHPERVFDLLIEGLDADFPAIRSLAPSSDTVPDPRTSFVGRKAEIARVEALIQASRLITLSGPGGTGKTRLARQVAMRRARDFSDGVTWVDLAPVAWAWAVPAAIATALGIYQQSGPTPLDAVKDHLSQREALLVLDNFEHLVEAAPVVAEILTAAPRVNALVTSRVVLRLSGEQEFSVPPLRTPGDDDSIEAISKNEAVALFVERARAANSGFALTTENASVIAEICARLDGLPLALELAASRARVLSPPEILRRLDDRLSLLTSGARDLPERRRTLRGAIAWSHDLLDEDERHLFARMAVFAGGATLEAAEAVARPETESAIDCLDLIGSLVEKSLLRRADVPGGQTRFDMLETIREFAGERLAEQGATDETARRHAEFFAVFSEQAEPEIVGRDMTAWLARCDREHDNIRAALRWSIDRAEPRYALRIGAALWRFWQQRGHLVEGGIWFEEMLAAPGGARDGDRVRALFGAGGLAYWRQDWDPAHRRYGEALEIARQVGDRRLEMEALHNTAFIPLVRDLDYERAGAVLEETLAIARELEDRRAIGRYLGDIGYTKGLQGEYEEAIRLNELAAESAREAGDRWLEADALSSLAQMYRMQGELEASRRYYLASLDIMIAAEDLPRTAYVFQGLAAIASAEGDHESTARLWAVAESIAARAGGSASAEVAMIGDVIGEARKAIGDQAVEQAMAEGAAMQLEEAVAAVRRA